jgi:acylpyruvate hydrolase
MYTTAPHVHFAGDYALPGDAMKLVSYRAGDTLRPGIVVDQALIAAEDAIQAAGLTALIPRETSRTILEAGPDAWLRLREAAEQLSGEGEAIGSLIEADLGPPVPDPDKIICLGLNYRDHATESNLALPVAPMLFAKFRNSLAGPFSPIVLPPVSEAVDYEAELAVVIGQPCKDVSANAALSHVAGVMALNDVSARDLQYQTSQWMAGKALDTFAPCGPALVFLDEIEDIQALSIRARLNGVTVQDGNTADMIFGVAETISFLSRLMTLVPGDVIATGTPAGVGFSRDPKLLLRDGDRVEVEIEAVGILSNDVVAGSGVRASGRDPQRVLGA